MDIFLLSMLCEYEYAIIVPYTFIKFIKKKKNKFFAMCVHSQKKCLPLFTDLTNFTKSKYIDYVYNTVCYSDFN